MFLQSGLALSSVFYSNIDYPFLTPLGDIILICRTADVFITGHNAPKIGDEEFDDGTSSSIVDRNRGGGGGSTGTDTVIHRSNSDKNPSNNTGGGVGHGGDTSSGDSDDDYSDYEHD